MRGGRKNTRQLESFVQIAEGAKAKWKLGLEPKGHQRSDEIR